MYLPLVFADYRTPTQLAQYFENMRKKTLVTKQKLALTDSPTSSGGDTNGRERPLSPLQEAQYIGTGKEFIHLYEESTIELVWGNDTGVAALDELDYLFGVTYIHPLNTITPRLVELCTKMDEQIQALE